jgi:hypothetical protein
MLSERLKKWTRRYLCPPDAPLPTLPCPVFPWPPPPPTPTQKPYPLPTFSSITRWPPDIFAACSRSLYARPHEHGSDGQQESAHAVRVGAARLAASGGARDGSRPSLARSFLPRHRRPAPVARGTPGSGHGRQPREVAEDEDELRAPRRKAISSTRATSVVGAPGRRQKPKWAATSFGSAPGYRGGGVLRGPMVS